MSSAVAEAEDPDAVVTGTFRLRYQTASEAIDLIHPLLTEQGAVELRPAENLLVLRDVSEAVERALELLAEFNPESAASTGVTGIDEDIVDFRPNLYERQRNAAEAVLAEGLRQFRVAQAGGFTDTAVLDEAYAAFADCEDRGGKVGELASFYRASALLRTGQAGEAAQILLHRLELVEALDQIGQIGRRIRAA